MEWEKTRFFVDVAPSAHKVISKEIENRACINNPYWQSSWIIIFLWKYYVVIADTLIGFWMSFSCCSLLYYQSFMRNKMDGLSYRKKYVEKFVWGTLHFWLHVLLLNVIFCRFFCLPTYLPLYYLPVSTALFR